MMLQGAFYFSIQFTPLFDSDPFINFDLIIVFDPTSSNPLFWLLGLFNPFHIHSDPNKIYSLKTHSLLLYS